MKKKIAVFGNGWSDEYLKLVLTGIRSAASGTDTDIYSFINYSSGQGETPDNLGEKVIFTLPELSDFDGVILLGNTINLSSERSYLLEEIKKISFLLSVWNMNWKVFQVCAPIPTPVYMNLPPI